MIRLKKRAQNMDEFSIFIDYPEKFKYLHFESNCLFDYFLMFTT